VWVALGLGSNVDARANLSACLDTLLLQFHDLALSSVFRSEADGGGSAPYLNMVVGCECALSLRELRDFTKALEHKLGRSNEATDAGRVSLDIDILLYGDLVGKHEGLTLPRPQMLEVAYVLWPLTQVAGKRRHPVLQEPYSALWKQFAGDRSRIAAVEFGWHGRRLSSAARP